MLSFEGNRILLPDDGQRGEGGDGDGDLGTGTAKEEDRLACDLKKLTSVRTGSCKTAALAVITVEVSLAEQSSHNIHIVSLSST